ncbi:hypothetical protein ACH5RR_018099 [Cinchona calisaya]|uniref:Uncharacterized protein n=1 Tax=Cinchona calisaya TaxID=153742 RepID=A0ABD2ZKG9_9GENT
MESSFRKRCVCYLLIIFISWVPHSLSRVIQDVSMIERHKQWMSSYGRQYKDIEEKEKRYNIFKANVEYIDLVNSAGNKPYRLGVNEFADLTNEEFKAAYIGYRTLSKRTKSTSFRYENANDFPPSVDWRKRGAVTPIRDSVCGAWTFPAVDTVEGLTKIKTGKLYTLSVQEILDCEGEGHGCDGGFVDDAFEFIKQHGLTTESNYPSKGNTSTCDTQKEAEPVTKISGYENVLVDNEKALLRAVVNQPVSVTVDALGVHFQFYSSGVFTGDCGTVLNHGVTLVGYGTSNIGKLKYWLIKNSWGTSWGEGGYMRMQRDVAAKEGLCGIAMEATYPVA